jgi:hypothetical protein
VTERVLTQDEVRNLTDEETDQVSGGALPFFAALEKWIYERQTHTDEMTIPQR